MNHPSRWQQFAPGSDRTVMVERVLRATVPPVPRIARIQGVAIAMFYEDHLVPHFHAMLAEYVMSVDIETLLVRGRFPRSARAMVLEWAAAHQRELLEDWRRARAGLPLLPIAPGTT